MIIKVTNKNDGSYHIIPESSIISIAYNSKLNRLIIEYGMEKQLSVCLNDKVQEITCLCDSISNALKTTLGQ